MRKTDLFTIIVTATIGIIIAFFVVNALLPPMKDVTIKTIEVISPSLAQPDPEVFNADALNPTVEVYVGDGGNTAGTTTGGGGE